MDDALKAEHVVESFNGIQVCAIAMGDIEARSETSSELFALML